MDKSFTDDLDIDSLSMVRSSSTPRRSSACNIPDDEVKNLQTVGDAVAFIEPARADPPVTAGARPP